MSYLMFLVPLAYDVHNGWVGVGYAGLARFSAAAVLANSLSWRDPQRSPPPLRRSQPGAPAGLRRRVFALVIGARRRKHLRMHGRLQELASRAS
jgi:hypothetical protein